MRIGNLVLAFVLTAGLSGVESYQKEDAMSRDRTAESESRGKQVVIDMEAESRLIVPCLRQAFQAAGWNWSTEFLTAYTGLAFVFSMKEDGGGIWQRENYEWSYFFDMLELLGDNFEILSVRLKGDSSVSPEVHFRTRAKAWDAVRVAIDAGLTPVVWQLQSEEMRKAKQVEMIYAREWALPRRGSRPFMWSLIVGYNEATQMYLVDSEASYGKYAVRWDAFGAPGPVKWFCVMVIKPQTEPFDALTAHRTVIQRAIEASQGMRPGNIGEARAHGLSAWEMWLDAFRKGTVSTHSIELHASFLRRNRGAAAVYLREIEHHFPEGARLPLREAAERYDEVSDAMEDLIGLEADGALDLEDGAKILSQALEHERAALSNLQSVLDTK